MRLSLLTTASAIALGFATARYLHPLARRRPVAARPSEVSRAGQHNFAPGAEHDVAEATRNFLLYFIIPLWTAAGVADWMCHRATNIETTGGVKETFLHLLMLMEMGVPILAGLFLEITSPILALMIGSFLLHEATALWDVSYAVKRRNVTPMEQHVHSFLELLPLMAGSFVAVLHWPQLQTLFGYRKAEPDRRIRIRLKRDPLPTAYVITTLAAMMLLEWLPFLEELWRDVRTKRPRSGR
jgi:hypothetical protein